jgi:hypothetical protein
VPLVLDDVLVNFDAERARLAAGLLRDFARAGQQVLLFTCHDHIARLFKSLKVEVRELPSRGQQPAAAVELVEAAPEPPPAVPELPTTPPARRPRRRFHGPHLVRPPRAVESPARPPSQPVEVDAESEPELMAVAARQTTFEPIVQTLLAPAQPVIVRIVEAPAPAIEPHPEPSPAPRRRMLRQVDESAWNAEEFDGELTDRVARHVVVVEHDEAVNGNGRK